MRLHIIPSANTLFSEGGRDRLLQAYIDQSRTDQPTSCTLFFYRDHLTYGIQHPRMMGLIVPGIGGCVYLDGKRIYKSGDLSDSAFDELYHDALTSKWMTHQRLSSSAPAPK